MRAEETVLSDVHLHAHADAPTTFVWRYPSLLGALDADGDRVVKRRRRMGELEEEDDFGAKYTLSLHHSLATTLADVGLQVWQGALVLGDLLVSQPTLVEAATVLELGGGCGLCGLLAVRLCAERVFITDTGDGVLQNAGRNVSDNGCTERAHVRRLDWTAPWPPVLSEAGDMFEWNARDLEALRSSAMILAADVVYDDALTDAFVSRLVELLRWLRGGRCTHSPFCLMGTERRINFCVDSLSTRAPAQDHFFAQLAQKGLDYEPIPLADVPQAFEYSRSKELRLYRIRLAEEHYR